jgi:ADP-heptose:LPS heptosyltransferase
MGYGGALIWSGLVRNIASNYPNKGVILLYSRSWREYFVGKKNQPDHVIYKNNPHILGVYDKLEWVFKKKYFDPKKIILLDLDNMGAAYWVRQEKGRIIYKKGHHAIQIACAAYNIPCQDMRAEVFFTKEEIEKVEELSREYGLDKSLYVCVEPNVQSTVGANKIWPWPRWEETVRLFHQDATLSNKVKLVQLGAPGSQRLSGCEYLPGHLSFRESGALISKSIGLVSYVGALMHMAKAVAKKSVIICSAWEPMELATYPDDLVLYSGRPCMNCGLLQKCEYDTACMSDISPKMVFKQIKNLLESKI